ncbi:MAG: YbaN family protein [Gemmataceae bacterium]
MPQATGLRRVLFVTAGLLCVGMAYVGVVLPGLPTTPWVLLASYCFGRSSQRLQRWLRRTPAFGRLLRDWEEHRGIRKPVKIFAVLLILMVVSASILSGRLPEWARWVVGACATCGICTILFLVPTVRPAPPSK